MGFSKFDRGTHAAPDAVRAAGNLGLSYLLVKTRASANIPHFDPSCLFLGPEGQIAHVA
jgi:hypothetical protein